jgi:hypothetical protein
VESLRRSGLSFAYKHTSTNAVISPSRRITTARSNIVHMAYYLPNLLQYLGFNFTGVSIWIRTLWNSSSWLICAANAHCYCFQDNILWNVDSPNGIKVLSQHRTDCNDMAQHQKVRINHYRTLGVMIMIQAVQVIADLGNCPPFLQDRVAEVRFSPVLGTFCWTPNWTFRKFPGPNWGLNRTG